MTFSGLLGFLRTIRAPEVAESKMRHHRINFYVLLISFALVIPCVAVAEAPPAARTTHFKLRLLSVSTSDPGNSKLESDAESGYAWTVEGGQRTLSYDLLHMAFKVEGKVTADVTMSAKRFARLQENGTVADMNLEQAPERVKTALADTFGVPLAKITVDANGREVEGSRTIVAVRASKAMMDNGALVSSTLMHPPFFADKKEWEAPATISIGDKNATEGTLTYTRVADENGLPTFSVAGTLVRDEVVKPGSALTDKNFKHVVKGKQSYNPALGEWVAATWNVDISFDVFKGEKRVGGTTGTIKVEFRKVDGEGE
jgi:hypothetical protein